LVFQLWYSVYNQRKDLDYKNEKLKL